jgi:hypothetical protein
MRVLGWGRHQGGGTRPAPSSLDRPIGCLQVLPPHVGVLEMACRPLHPIPRGGPSAGCCGWSTPPNRLRFSQHFLGELRTDVTSTRIVANVLTTATPLAEARADFETSANTHTQSMETAPECAGRNGPKGARVTPIVTLDRAPRSVNLASRDGPHATPRHRASRPT